MQVLGRELLPLWCQAFPTAEAVRQADISWPLLAHAAALATHHLGGQLSPETPPQVGCPPLRAYALTLPSPRVIKLRTLPTEAEELIGWLPRPLREPEGPPAHPLGTQCFPGWKPRLTALLSPEGFASDGMFSLYQCDYSSLLVTCLASVGLAGTSSRGAYQRAVWQWAGLGPDAHDALWTVTSLVTSFRTRSTAAFQHPGGWFLDYLHSTILVRAQFSAQRPIKYLAVSNWTYTRYPDLFRMVVRAAGDFPAGVAPETASPSLQDTCGDILETYASFLMAIGQWPACFALVATCIVIDLDSA